MYGFEPENKREKAFLPFKTQLFHIQVVRYAASDNKAGEISFQDPIYAYWLKTEYFAK